MRFSVSRAEEKVVVVMEVVVWCGLRLWMRRIVPWAIRIDCLVGVEVWRQFCLRIGLSG